MKITCCQSQFLYMIDTIHMNDATKFCGQFHINRYCCYPALQISAPPRCYCQRNRIYAILGYYDKKTVEH